MKTKILYWPGIGKNLNVLKSFREELKKEGYEIEVFNENYDENELSPYNWEQVINNNSDWWIGISLGASLLYYVYSFVPKEKRPSRLTLINPFYSRIILSEEKGFDITKYWNFSPIDMKEELDHAELIISTQDKSINNYHGLILSSSINSNSNYLFTVNSDHTLITNNIQKCLSKILLSYKEGEYKYEKKDNYCNIYKQQRSKE